jgi:hypothetical protein
LTKIEISPKILHKKNSKFDPGHHLMKAFKPIVHWQNSMDGHYVMIKNLATKKLAIGNFNNRK